MSGAEALEWLLADQNRRVPALDMFGKPFEIGIYRHEFGFLVATGYRDGQVLKDGDGVILSRAECCRWLDEAAAIESETLKAD